MPDRDGDVKETLGVTDMYLVPDGDDSGDGIRKICVSAGVDIVNIYHDVCEYNVHGMSIVKAR